MAANMVIFQKHLQKAGTRRPANSFSLYDQHYTRIGVKVHFNLTCVFQNYRFHSHT